MTTERVRVSGYVSPDLAALIDETAAALGESRSAVVAEVLGNAAPVLEVMRDLGEQLRAAPERHREVLADFAASMRPVAEQVQLALDGLDRVARAGG